MDIGEGGWWLLGKNAQRRKEKDVTWQQKQITSEASYKSIWTILGWKTLSGRLVVGKRPNK